MTYEEAIRKKPLWLLDKFLWVYLWPIVLVALIFETRIRLMPWPKRLNKANGCTACWFIDRWLVRKNKAVEKIFMGYWRGAVKP